MKDRKFGTEVANATQEVNALNGVKQTVKINSSDMEKLSSEALSAIAHNVSHKIQLKQDDAKEVHDSPMLQKLEEGI